MDNQTAKELVRELQKIRKAIEFSNELHAAKPEDIPDELTPSKQQAKTRAAIAQQIANGEIKPPK